MNRLLLEVAVGVALAFACYVLYHQWQAEKVARVEAEQAVEAMQKSQEIEHANFERELAIAGQRAATERGVQRLCHQISLPVTPTGPNEPSRADPAAGQLGQLTGEVIACRRNASRLIGLQDWVRTNSEKP